MITIGKNWSYRFLKMILLWLNQILGEFKPSQSNESALYHSKHFSVERFLKDCFMSYFHGKNGWENLLLKGVTHWGLVRKS